MRRTPEFEAFIAPARRYTALWRIVLALGLGFFVYIFGLGFVVGLLEVVLNDNTFETETEFNRVFTRVMEGATPADFAILFATFIPYALGVITMGWWHWRGPSSFFGRHAGFADGFMKGVAVIFALTLPFHLPGMIFGAADLTQQLSLSFWLGALIWVLPLILIQITAEEMLFRGYLTQQLAARFNHALIWMGVPALLFGMIHWAPGMTASQFAVITLVLGLFGLALADLTRVTGNLGAAVGLHFGNNCVAVLFVAVPGKMSGVSLYLQDVATPGILESPIGILYNILLFFCCWGLMRLWLTR